MSAWASGSLVEKLRQKRQPAQNSKAPTPPPATPAPTAPATASSSDSKDHNMSPAVKESAAPAPETAPVETTAREAPRQQDAASAPKQGPLSLPHDIEKLLSEEFTFVGVVNAPPAAGELEEAKQSSAPKSVDATSPPITSAPRYANHEVPQMMGKVDQVCPVRQPHHHHHHHHHYRHPYQHRHHLHQSHNYQYRYQPQQPQQQPPPLQQPQQQQQQQQQSYMQHNMIGQPHRGGEYGSMPFNMSPHAMPYQPCTYNRFPGMGMGMYGAMNEYGGFSLQGRPAYYPPPQNQTGPYGPSHHQ